MPLSNFCLNIGGKIILLYLIDALCAWVRFASRNYEEYKERRRERIEEKHEEGIIEEVGSSSGSQWCAIVPPVPKQRQMSMSGPGSAHKSEHGTIGTRSPVFRASKISAGRTLPRSSNNSPARKNRKKAGQPR